MTIPNCQEALEKFQAQHFTERARNPELNGGAHGFVPSPPMGDEEIIRLCRKARNAAKFASLFDDGDLTDYEGDDSRADQALVSMIAFNTQGRDQIDRIFRRSALYRDKWERCDYRARTIDFALNNLNETYRSTNVSSSTSPYSGSDDYCRFGEDDRGGIPGLVTFANEPEPKPVEFVLKKVMPRGYVTGIHGAGGSAKSIAGMICAIPHAGGLDEFLGLEVLHHGPALYLDSELDQRGQHPRVVEMCRGLGIEVPEGLHYISALGLRTEEAFERAYRAAKELGITLLVIDSWGPLMEGDMANAKEVISFYNRYLDPFVAQGITVFIVDYQSRVQEGQNYQKKGAFGSVYKENLLRSVLQVQKVDEDRDDEGRIRIRVRHRKSNFGPTIEPFEAIIQFGSGKITAKAVEMSESEKAIEETLSARDRIKAALVNRKATVKELVEDTGLNTGTVRNKLSELMPDEIRVASQNSTTKHYALASDLSSSLTPEEGDGNDGRSEEDEQLWTGVL